jgi:uncharacterized glyoxalase superfamily protein PhnB
VGALNIALFRENGSSTSGPERPLGTTFFSPSFGMCIDRFGTPWMIMVEPQAES